MRRPAEVPGLKNCGYDYCADPAWDPRSPQQIEKDLLEKSTLPEDEEDVGIESAASVLVKAAKILAEEQGTEAADPTNLSVREEIKEEVNVPGDILPVESESGMTQRVHILGRNKEGVGFLRSPSGKERPLTASDIKLFKQYMLNLGKLLKVMKPSAGT